jgi:Zn-dependent peptidase ImmA (M78 family)
VSAPPLHGGERAARIARRALGLDVTQPIHDLLDVAEESLDVPVFIDHFDDDKIAGLLLRRGDGDAFIAVNADHGAVRQRFTLAHELGHLHMGHQPRVDMATDVFGRGRGQQEIEANYFAAEFLAPRPAVLAWLEEHELIDRAQEPSTVVQLGLQFGMSFPAVSYRLERAGAVSTRAKQRLLDEVGRTGSDLARLHAAHRLMDTIETLWRGSDYPHLPRRTVSYAEQARASGLLDEEEYRAIVTTPTPEIDFADWLA